MANIKSPPGGGTATPAVELRQAPGGGPLALSLAEKDAPAFAAKLRSDPAAALAAVGVTVSPEEARRVSQQLRELSPAPGSASQMKNIKIKGEISVSIKIGIGK
ncbi:MAG TPA: hypothetical protein VF693_06300 [Allosphingosinicella sp.]